MRIIYYFQISNADFQWMLILLLGIFHENMFANFLILCNISHHRISYVRGEYIIYIYIMCRIDFSLTEPKLYMHVNQHLRYIEEVNSSNIFLPKWTHLIQCSTLHINPPIVLLHNRSWATPAVIVSNLRKIIIWTI